jgi:hypothetical protein
VTHDCYSTKRTTVWREVRNEKEGVAVKYGDGYISWCPMEVYERDYNPVVGGHLTFGQALDAMQNGRRIRRQHWRDKWLTLAGEFWTASFRHFGAHAPRDFAGCEPFIAVFTSSRRYGVWTPTHEDLLADDWEEIREPVA